MTPVPRPSPQRFKMRVLMPDGSWVEFHGAVDRPFHEATHEMLIAMQKGLREAHFVVETTVTEEVEVAI